jgi:hypothetical protein
MRVFRLIYKNLPFILFAALLAGCATPITVTSSPEGAAVYCRGSGRPSYRWKYRGNAPVTFKVYYNAVQRGAVRQSGFRGRGETPLRAAEVGD